MSFDRLYAPGKFNPLGPGHPGIGSLCVLCSQPLLLGQRPALVSVGPASDEDAAKAAEGKAYIADSKLVHERCAFPGSGE